MQRLDFHFSIQFVKERMAQSSKAIGRGRTQRKSINVPLGSSAGGSAPSVSSEVLGAVRPSGPSQNLAAVAKQQAQQKKYPYGSM